MNGNRNRRKLTNWRAAELLQALMADRGWHAADVERESWPTGHPLRAASRRTIYRVTNEGHIPLAAAQFEIAAVFGLLPSHLWGSVPLPEPYAYLNIGVRQVAA